MAPGLIDLQVNGSPDIIDQAVDAGASLSANPDKFMGLMRLVKLLLINALI